MVHCLLSQARYLLSACTVGPLAIFAGGIASNGAASNVVDIYNSITNQWSTTTLSQTDYLLAAAGVGRGDLRRGQSRRYHV